MGWPAALNRKMTSVGSAVVPLRLQKEDAEKRAREENERESARERVGENRNGDG